MKHLPALLAASLLLTACHSDQNRLSISIQGMPDDSLICTYITPDIIRQRSQAINHLIGGTRTGEKVDFTIPLPDDHQLYKIYLAPQSYRGDGPNQNIELFLLPGENDVHIAATYEKQRQTLDYTISGSPETQRWKEQDQTIQPLQLQLGMLASAANILPPATPTGDSLRQQIQRLDDSLRHIKTAYILRHPADQLSGYWLTTIGHPATADSLYRTLDPSVQRGPLKTWLDLQKEQTAKIVASIQARQNMIPGSAIPDLTLPDASGKDLTLSSLYGSGKYIVLDFWGTWCGWCIKSMPKMKETYAQLGSGTRVEFVGIDCGDTQDQWLATLQTQKLPWINLRAEGDDIPLRYGIEAFPTKIILAPTGHVVARYTGEAPDFYTTLDSLVNKL